MNQSVIYRLLPLFVFTLLAFVHSAKAFIPADENQEPYTLAPLVEKIKPAVVNISTMSKVPTMSPLMDDPFFRYFYGQRPNPKPRARQATSAGSGVIVDAKEGIVVTNAHVIKGADQIEVGLSDGRKLKAKLLGADEEVDIAVLQIKADKLVDLKIADANRLRVGDFVVAVGNPFGLGQTVTSGLVSALGRSGLGIEGYENFIQTDASINPGNSGGALVNLKGELIGINTAIISPAGGNVGIGFAIPTDMMKNSLDQIVESGEVKRGQLGVMIQALTEDLAEALGVETTKGVLISQVLEDSPAEKAGLQDGDIIIQINDKQTDSVSDLRNAIGLLKPGTKITVKYIREGKEGAAKVKLMDKDQLSKTNDHKLFKGVILDTHPQGGLMITRIDPSSEAALAGLRQSDVIVSINKQPVNALSEANKILHNNDGSLLIQVLRGGYRIYIIIK